MAWPGDRGYAGRAGGLRRARSGELGGASGGGGGGGAKKQGEAAGEGGARKLAKAN